MTDKDFIYKIEPNKPYLVDGLDWSWAYVIFKELEDFKGYWIGTNGILWSFRDNSGKPKDKCRIMKPFKVKRGHLKKFLTYSNMIRRTCYIHTLVLEAFISKRPNGLVCRHKDGNPKNNNWWNLNWGTVLDNIHDRDIIHKTTAVGEAYPNAVLKNSDIGIIYDLYENGWLICDIADKFNIDHSGCCKILRGKTWHHAAVDRIPPLKGKDARKDRPHWITIKTRKYKRSENHPNAKLTQKQANQIRYLYKPHKVSYKELSKMFGVSIPVITNIIKNRSYIDL